MILKTRGKRGINTAEGCNEIIFPSVHFLFRRILEMGSSGCELKSNVVGCHEVLEKVGGFIVNILDCWLKYTGSEVGMYDFIVSCNFCSTSTLHGFNKDGVAIIIIND